jgi:hypothetical protein
LKLYLQKYFNLSQLYLYGFFLVAIGLVCSRFLVSVGTFLAIGAWLVNGNPLSKFKIALSNKWVWVLISLYLLHALSLFWSSEYTYAWIDLRIKIPLLIFPILLASVPLSYAQVKKIFNIYVLTLLVISVYYFVSFYIIRRSASADYRSFNRFDSHIRYGLQLIMGTVICVHAFLKGETKINKWYYIFLSLFFILTLYILKSFNAYIVFLIVLFFILKYASKQYYQFKLLFVLVSLASAGLIAFGAYIFYDEYKNMAKIDTSIINPNEKTKGGLDYYHDTENEMTENGFRTMAYICNPEIYKAWEMRSRLPIISVEGYHTNTYYALQRYLTSKGLRKDAEGIRALNNDDIINIENGCTNFKYCQNNRIRTRVHEFWYEIKEYELLNNPNGHSVPLRFEYWKTASHIIKRYPFLGTGIGDYENEFYQQYNLDDSILTADNRLRSHNQFLSMTVAFGFLGLCIFCISLFYPLRANLLEPWIYQIFLIIIFFSFFGEDTLETQIGVTFYAFWNSLLIFSKKEMAIQ